MHWETTISNKLHNIWSHSQHWNTVHLVGYCTLVHVNKHLGSTKYIGIWSAHKIHHFFCIPNKCNTLNTHIYQIPPMCITPLWGRTLCFLVKNRMLIQSRNRMLQNVKYTFFAKFSVFFLHCLQQCVMHIFFCWAMDQSHHQTFQDTGTTQQQDTRAFKISTSLQTQTQLGAVKI